MNDDEIKEVLRKIQPEGFNWVDNTETEMVKFRAIAQEAQSKAIPDEEMVETIKKVLVDKCPFVDTCNRQCTPTDQEVCYGEVTESILSQLNIPARIEAAKKEELERIKSAICSNGHLVTTKYGHGYHIQDELWTELFHPKEVNYLKQEKK